MSVPTVEGFTDLQRIGAGGYSQVFRAFQARFGRYVAIKVLNFGVEDEADRRAFERETELMGRVSTHHHVVTVYDIAFTSDNKPCIVMEHYAGGSLANFIAASGQLRVNEALDVGVKIASALATLHSEEILHCDIKPQNILISDSGQPALTDFGISTAIQEHTGTGPQPGFGMTLHYAAPELLEENSPTERSDVYSLAATIYEGLAGHKPFPSVDGSQTSQELARRIALEEPRPLTSHGVDRAVAELVHAAMAKNPLQRPADAESFAYAVHEVGTRLGVGLAPVASGLFAGKQVSKTVGPIDLSFQTGAGLTDRQTMVSVRMDATGADLVTRFEEQLGTSATKLKIERTGVVIDLTQAVGELDVVRGDALVAYDAVVNDHESRIVLRPRTAGAAEQSYSDGVVLGRSTVADHGVDVPSISNEHCQLDIAGSVVRVTDRSTNGTFVNGDRVMGSAVLSNGDQLEIGPVMYDFLGIAGRERSPATHLTRRGPIFEVVVSPNLRFPRPETHFSLRDAPKRPAWQRFAPASLVVALVVAVFGIWLLSPLLWVAAALGVAMILWLLLDGRRSGRSTFAEAAGRYQHYLDETALEIDDAVAKGSAWRRCRAFPDARILGIAAAGDEALWSRVGSHDDFLTVAVADADQDSLVTFDQPKSGAPELLESARKIIESYRFDERVPVEIDLAHVGVVSLVGQREQALAVAYSLAAQLAVLRSPSSVEFEVVRSDANKDWDWVKWLPHKSTAARPFKFPDEYPQADEMLATLYGTARERLAGGPTRDTSSRHLVAFVDASSSLGVREFRSLCLVARQASMTLVVLVEDPDLLREPPDVTVDLRGKGFDVSFRGEDKQFVNTVARGISKADVQQMSRDLAPFVEIVSP